MCLDLCQSGGGGVLCRVYSRRICQVSRCRRRRALVVDGMIVGLGSGTTAAILVRKLGERVKDEGLRITAVSTSDETARLAKSLGIPLQELDAVSALDINLDGADEIDAHFRMIKGRGGALLREKIVACASNHRVTMITADKRVERLGTGCPSPSRSA